MNAKRKAADTVSGKEGVKKMKSISSFFTPAAESSSASATTAKKFDKQKWITSLSGDHKELLKLEIDTMEESWLGALKEMLVSQKFLDLKRFLRDEWAAERNGKGPKIFPKMEDVYSWSRYCPLDKVKVVVLGQDPYHGQNQAMGLSFSVRSPTPAPPSLLNMYKALSNDYPTFQRPPARGGSLIPWASRGVLMLNACLTVQSGQPNSHANRGWEMLTGRVIELVAQRRAHGVVFMAWGTPAQKRVTNVDKNKHLVLTSVHPSPLSASRGFFTCGHFKKANEWLESRYGAVNGPIDWSLSGTTPVGLSTPPPDVATAQDETKDGKDEEFVGDDDEEAMIQAAIEAENAENAKVKNA